MHKNERIWHIHLYMSFFFCTFAPKFFVRICMCLHAWRKDKDKRMSKYDYLIVGTGLFGATFAYKATQAGKRCLVIDKRPHAGGNVYCEKTEGINVHKYGAHIFHTSNKEVWDFVNSLVPFNRYTNSPVANYKGELYNLPFNMNTFAQMWGVITPDEAKAKIEEQRAEAIAALNGREPQNLEEQALCLVGKDIFEKLIKEYNLYSFLHFVKKNG